MTVSEATAQPPSKRQHFREQNRQALIEATLSSIAELGIANTSVSEIITRAGLSRGMIHLHFGSKDMLLVAALKHASDEYYRGLETLLEDGDGGAVSIIKSIVKADLSEKVLNQRTVKVWYAFRGEARESNVYASLSDTRDKRLRGLAHRAFSEICNKSGSKTPENYAKHATNGLLAMLEGMWTDYLIHPDKFDRSEAEGTVFTFLNALFPDLFAPMGT